MTRKFDGKRPGINSTSKRKWVVVFCEGENTESTYIHLLEKEKLIDWKKFDLKLFQKKGFYKSQEFIEFCTNTFNSEFKKEDTPLIDSIWMVFDDDEHDVQAIFNLKPKDFCNAKGFKGKVFCAFSSMCIEYWILLHFKEHNGDPIFSCLDKDHSCRTIDLINKEIKAYNKKRNANLRVYEKTKKWVEDIFEFFMSPNEENNNKTPRIVEAFQRAKKIHEAKPNGKQYTESVTTLYRLLEYLGVIKYKNVVFDRANNKVYDNVVEKKGIYFNAEDGKEIKCVYKKDIKKEPFLNRMS